MSIDGEWNDDIDWGASFGLVRVSGGGGMPQFRHGGMVDVGVKFERIRV